MKSINMSLLEANFDFFLILSSFKLLLGTASRNYFLNQ